MNKELAMHEILDLHELLGFKVLCATKTKTMMPLVSCDELKGLMQKDLDMTTRHMEELKQLLEQAKL